MDRTQATSRTPPQTQQRRAGSQRGRSCDRADGELPLEDSTRLPNPERWPQGPENRQYDRTWRPDEHRRPVGL